MTYHVRPGDLAPRVDEPVPPDHGLPSVCVIGAGPSGLAATKALHAGRVPVDCFEAGPVVGGNWVLDNPNGTSACYSTLEINTSCPRMAFSDFPMPASHPAYARHWEVRQYFEDYVDHFGFRSAITFDARVEQVRPEPDGSWSVEISRAGAREVRHYDAVVVANGHHWAPHLPDPAYPGTFDGEQWHAHDYRDPSQLRDRHVLVVGMGNSAMDIAVEAGEVAASATISVRRGQWVLRKTLDGRAVDQRTLPARTPWRLKRLGYSWLARRSGDPEAHGLPRPDHAPGASHPVQSDRFYDALASGAIVPRGAIERLAGDRVVFRDGTGVRVDLIVWCTGYEVRFPFLDPDLVSAPGNHLPLFHRTIHPDLPGLYFVGLLQPLGAVMPLAQAQSELITARLRGEYRPPSPAVVREAAAAQDTRARRRFYDSPRHTMEVDFDAFLADLRRERRAGARRAARATGAAGKLVAVTGAAQGIGLAVAKALVASGASVALGDLDAGLAAAGAARLGAAARGFPLDVTDRDSFAAFLEEAERHFGRPLDVLVNNAGVMWVGPFADEPEPALAHQLAVNLTGVLNGVRLAAPGMVARGSGHVITVASAASVLPVAGEATYSASKHAVLGYCSAVRHELRGSGVEVSVVLPVVVDTALAAGTTHGRGPRLLPEDVADAVVRTVTRPRPRVFVPAPVGLLAAALAVLPGRARDALHRLTVPNQVQGADPRARSDYQQGVVDAGAQAGSRPSRSGLSDTARTA